jgi:hypothetical protein
MLYKDIALNNTRPFVKGAYLLQYVNCPLYYGAFTLFLDVRHSFNGIKDIIDYPKGTYLSFMGRGIP